MKKSITFLASALLAAGAAFAAEHDSTDTAVTQKYISFADDTQIETEMGDLKKATRTLTETIEADRDITEAPNVDYVCLPKQPVALMASKFRN